VCIHVVGRFRPSRPPLHAASGSANVTSVEAQQLLVGRSYAFREKRSTSCPLLRVKLIEKVGRNEEELRLKGNQPGERWYHQYRRDLSPGYALARQWAGLEQEGEVLRKEIARLHSLISGAAYDLETAGQERKAKRLLRALEGR
jgi:hypothetical protein